MLHLTCLLKKVHLHPFKLYLSLYCCIVIPASGQMTSSGNTYKIEGKIRNFGDGSLVGTIRDLKNNSFRTDTIVVKEGRFSHTGQIDEEQIVNYETIEPKFAKFKKVLKDGDSVNFDFSDKRSRSIEVLVSPGSKIKVNGIAQSYLDAYPSGNDGNNLLAALNKKIKVLSDLLSNLDYTDKGNIKNTVRIEDSLLTAIRKLEYDFVSENPASIVSSYIIWKEFEPLNKRNPVKADSLYSLIHPAKENIYNRQILLTQKSRSTSNASIAVGDMFPAFSTKLVYKGAAFSLDQTRGKYTFIDFWGTWCLPCIKEMPKLKAYYEKFQSKLNIVGVAGRDQYQNWKAFLDRNNYDWIQVIDQSIPKLSDQLNLRVYPTKYLLDPSGKILFIFKDSGEEVWKELDKLLDA